MKTKIIIKYLLLALLLVASLDAVAARYVLTCEERLITESMQVALREVGTIEQAENLGAVTKYQRSAGIAEGAAYCAAGQYYAFAVAARKLSLDEREIPIPRQGVANDIYNYAEKFGIATPKTYSRHDLIIWRRSGTWRGHVERIVIVGKAGWVHTIGFNVTTTCNGREVEGVFIKKRNVRHLLGRMVIRGYVGFSAEAK